MRVNKKEAAEIIKSLVISYALRSERLHHPEDHATDWKLWDEEAKRDLKKLAEMGINVDLL